MQTWIATVHKCKCIFCTAQQGSTDYTDTETSGRRLVSRRMTSGFIDLQHLHFQCLHDHRTSPPTFWISKRAPDPRYWRVSLSENSIANIHWLRCLLLWLRDGLKKKIGKKYGLFFGKKIDPHLFFRNKTPIGWNEFYTWSHLKIYLFSAFIMASIIVYNNYRKLTKTSQF